MKGLSQGTELLKFARDPESPEWYFAQLAINQTPCIVFSVQTPEIAKMSEAQLGAYLERQASALIEKYGDARNPNMDAFKEYMEA